MEKEDLSMNNLKDYVKWIARQNAINLTEGQIKEFTGWMIKDKKYQEFQHELIRRMKIVENK